MISDQVWLALIVGIPAFLGPMIALTLTKRSDSRAKAADSIVVAASKKLEAETIAAAKAVEISAIAEAKKVEDDARRRDKQEDYARQDAVAAQAAEAARLLSDRQDQIAARAAEDSRRLLARQDTLADQAKESVAQAKEAAAILKTNTEAVAKTAEETKGQLKIIHTLVNSTLTASMQGLLDSTKRELVLLLEIGELKKAHNVEPSADAAGVIEETRKAIAELTITLDARHRATAVAAVEAETAKIAAEAVKA